MTLQAGAVAGVPMTLADVSRGGCTLAGPCRGLLAGTEVTLDIPSLGLTLPARVARVNDAGLGLAFRQNAVTVADADRLLVHVRGQRVAA